MKRDDPATGSRHKAFKAGHHHQKESHDLPESYGETRVVLLPVTPNKVHAFWEFAPEASKDSSLRESGKKEEQEILRLHEAGGSPTESGQKDTSLEVPIEPHAKSKYVNLQQSGKSYQAEIGHSGKEGQFIPAAQSNIAETPRPLPVPEKTRPHEPAAGPGQQPPAPRVSPQPTWGKPPEQASEHRHPAHRVFPPADHAVAPQQEQSPFAPPHDARTALHTITQESPAPGMPNGEGSRFSAESEALLIKRRTAIFRHLSEAVPLSEAGNALAAEQADQPGPNGTPREKDLTEISEQKFVAGISS